MVLGAALDCTLMLPTIPESYLLLVAYHSAPTNLNSNRKNKQQQQQQQQHNKNGVADTSGVTMAETGGEASGALGLWGWSWCMACMDGWLAGGDGAWLGWMAGWLAPKRKTAQLGWWGWDMACMDGWQAGPKKKNSAARLVGMGHGLHGWMAGWPEKEKQRSSVGMDGAWPAWMDG